MSRSIALVSAAVLALGLAGSTLAADAATPVIRQHRIHQQQRIGQGVRSGRLTPRETMRLERGQWRVQAMIRRAKADGVITPRERAQIRRAQGMQSRHIWRGKHNARTI